MTSDNEGLNPLKKDPAFERFYRYRETAGERFKVTNKNLFPIFVLMVAIPIGLTYISYQSQGKFLRYEKRRTKPIYDNEFKP